MFPSYKARICRGHWKFRKCMARFLAYSARPVALKRVQSFINELWRLDTHRLYIHFGSSIIICLHCPGRPPARRHFTEEYCGSGATPTNVSNKRFISCCNIIRRALGCIIASYLEYDALRVHTGSQYVRNLTLDGGDICPTIHIASGIYAQGVKPNPCTSKVPMMMVSVPQCVAACWLFCVGSTGICAGCSAWVDNLAARAAAPISITGIGCDNGRDEGCWDDLGCRCWDETCAVGFWWLSTCRSWEASVSADEVLCWTSPGVLWLCERLPRCRLWVTTLNSAGVSSLSAASRELVMLITFDRSESYFSTGTISLSLFVDVDCCVSEDVLTLFFACLRIILKQDISRLSLSFSFISFFISHFCLIGPLYLIIFFKWVA